MRVIVDVMSGDRAPLEMILGVADAAKQCTASFILVGNREEIEKIGRENELDLSRFDIADAPSVIYMEDEPLCVVRAKKDSSMAVGLQMLADGKGDAFVSAGNTGALFTGATLIVRKIRGVQRAAIGTLLPTEQPCLLLDSGANVTVIEENLEQFAVMGSAYVRKICGIENPTVGLLNNGTEDCKGTPLQVEVNRRLRGCPEIFYVGNVEGSAVPFGACNVLVADGFTGNVFLKTMEGVGKLILSSVRDAFTRNALTKMSALMLKPSLLQLKRTLDPSEHGGAPFLGISKPVIKAHGSSDARAFMNAIFAAIDYAKSDAVYDIAEAAEAFTARKKAEREALCAEEDAEKDAERCEKQPDCTPSAEENS